MTRYLRLICVIAISMHPLRIAFANDESSECARMVAAIETVEGKPWHNTRAITVDELQSTGVIGFYGTHLEDFFTRHIFHSRLERGNGSSGEEFSIFTTNPLTLLAQGLLRRLECQSFMDIETLRHWPKSTRALSLAIEYADAKERKTKALQTPQGDTIPIGDRSRIVLGVDRSIFDGNPFTPKVATSITYSSTIFDYPSFMISRAARIKYISALIFPSKADRSSFQRALQSLKDSLSLRMAASETGAPRKISVSDALTLFENSPGKFMTEMADPQSQLRATIVTLSESERTRFQAIHPDTWELVVDRYGDQFKSD